MQTCWQDPVIFKWSQGIGAEKEGIQRDGQRNLESNAADAEDKVTTTTTIYLKKGSAFTRMERNEISKPLAQIPIVEEMYRAVTFPFLRWNGVKSSRRLGWGEVHMDSPLNQLHPKAHPLPHPLFFSLALQTQSTFKTGRQQQTTWEQPLSYRLSGSQSNFDSLTWKARRQTLKCSATCHSNWQPDVRRIKSK